MRSWDHSSYGSHSVTCHPIEAILTPLPRHIAGILIYRPRKDERLSWPRWLVSKMVYPQSVTHPSINRAGRWVTPLIKTNALPLSQATTSMTYCVQWEIKTYSTNCYMLIKWWVDCAIVMAGACCQGDSDKLASTTVASNSPVAADESVLLSFIANYTSAKAATRRNAADICRYVILCCPDQHRYAMVSSFDL